MDPEDNALIRYKEGLITFENCLEYLMRMIMDYRGATKGCSELRWYTDFNGELHIQGVDTSGQVGKVDFLIEHPILNDTFYETKMLEMVIEMIRGEKEDRHHLSKLLYRQEVGKE